jgi:peptidyl-prolyl cis-trans isomerase C
MPSPSKLVEEPSRRAQVRLFFSNPEHPSMKSRTLAATAAAMLAAALALPAAAQNVAVVNGKSVPQARLDALKEQIKQQAERTGRPVPPEAELDKQLKEEVVTREVFMQEAEKEGLQATPDFMAKMELARQSVLIGELFANYMKKNPVTDAEAKAEYDRVIGSQTPPAGAKEYKARHILISADPENKDKDKADADAKAKAEDIIAQLKKGGKFEEIAKKESKDPGSGAQGGDLGWANPAGYVPEFSEAMQKLEKGQTSETPVKSQFGWHIIHVDDIREAKAPEPPKFDDVKPQVVQQLQQQKLAKYQQELREKAKVE